MALAKKTSAVSHSPIRSTVGKDSTIDTMIVAMAASAEMYTAAR
jgi:hypothetical protein